MPELKLLCEYSISPIDIQTQFPRFSWLLDDSSIPEQLSYRITVACDQAFKQLVWDSGTVQSRASLGIVYGGAPLKDCSEYYWKVHILCRGALASLELPALKPPYPQAQNGRGNGFPIHSLWTDIPYCSAAK